MATEHYIDIVVGEERIQFPYALSYSYFGLESNWAQIDVFLPGADYRKDGPSFDSFTSLAACVARAHAHKLMGEKMRRFMAGQGASIVNAEISRRTFQ
jgi:hypothetical protein